MGEDTEANTIQVSHKDEAKARVAVDVKDRAGLLQKLDTSLNPLDHKKYPTERNIITKKVENKAERNKSSHFGESEMFCLNAAYLRALLSGDCNIDVGDVLSCEPSVLQSMFTNNGMQLCKRPNLFSRDCSRLKFPEDMQALLTSLQLISQLFCSLENPFAHWWQSWKFVENFKRHLAPYITGSGVYLIFDMYYKYTIKSVMWMLRRLVQLWNIIWCDLQPFHPRRLCCPQLTDKQLIHIPYDDLT